MSGNPGAAPSVLRLLDLRDAPLSVDEVLAAVADPRAGGVALFVGTVRSDDHGRGVHRLDYTAHPGALAELTVVAEGVAAAHPVIGLAAVHRTGALAVGELAVVVAASTPHRGEAFTAARALIDEIKTRVPIWKHQTFDDASEEWVGSP